MSNNTATGHTSLLNNLTSILLPALAYFVAARLSLFLAIPPSEAAAVWPPAGIAVASIILLGKRAVAGVFLGALATYAISWLDFSSAAQFYHSALLMLLLTIGPTLQAYVVGLLVRRFSQPNLAYITEAEIIRFLFICAPIGCLVASSISNLVFYLNGIASANDLPMSWFTWWVGDSIGVMTVTPLVLVLFQRSGPGVASRRRFVGIPMIVLLGIVFVLFFYSQQRDNEELRGEFESRAAFLHNDIEVGLEQNINVIYSLKAYIEGSNEVTADEFDLYARTMLARNPHIQALEWIPRVTADERDAYEQSSPAGPIVELDEDGARIPATPRAEYFPVQFVTPLAGNERAWGWDVSTSPVSRLAQQNARNSSQPSATAPIKLVQERSQQPGVVIYLSVYDRGRFRGFVAVVIRIEDFISYLLQSSSHSQQLLKVSVQDISNEPISIYTSEEQPDLATNMGLQTDQILNFYGRLWQISYQPAEALLLSQSRNSSMLLLLGGMLFTALFGGWLLTMTGRTIRIAQEVDRRTTELRQQVAERELVQKELSKLSMAVQHSPSMVLICDPKGIIEYINPKFAEVTGYSLADLRSHDVNELHEAEYGPGFYTGLIRGLNLNKDWKGEVRSRRKNGEYYWTQLSLAPVYDSNGELSHVVSVYQDISETRAIQERISYQATHDALTGLINRYEFERELQRLIEQKNKFGTTHAYCFCDLDQFKVINDTSGHAAGDELLKQVAQLLQNNLRKNDILARLGGDEFGILMENSDLQQAQTVAQKVLAELEEYRFVWEGSLHRVGVSIGVVLIDENCLDVTDVLKNADSACYAAKEAGRNRYHVYKADDELLARREGEISWIGVLNTALEEGSFELYGQIIEPILDASLKPSIEVLVRLRRDGELVVPGAFLPAAERYGMSPRIDRWIVDRVFKWMANNSAALQWIDSVAINLSGASLSDSKLLEFIYEQVRTASFNPSSVKFEITETAAITNLNDTRKFISTLKEMGCGFSLDDFGSGLSSFAYLKNLDVDYLKIDGMFVKDIATDPIDRAMVKSINEIGKVMNKQTIAEFVENDEVLAHLRDLGVDYAQGYGIGMPKPLAQVVNDIRSRSNSGLQQSAS